MEKIFDLGKVAYVAAPPQKEVTAVELIKLTIRTFIDFLQVCALSIPYLIQSFFYIFVPRPKKKIAGNVALVTGAGNGIGKCIALRLAKEGCHIAVVDIEEAAALRTAEEVKKFNVKAVAYHLDITDHDGAQKLCKKIEEDLAPVDILVNNAAILPLLSLREGAHEEVKRIIDVNVTANLIMTRIFLAGMLERRRGHIVNMSSLSAFHAVPGAIVYSATKYALLGFSEALSEELRQDGYGNCVHVTSVHPYFTATRNDLEYLQQLNRFAFCTPADIADVTVDGVLRNQLHVCKPASSRWLGLFLTTFPYKVQHLTRDIILREKRFRKFSKGIKSNNNSI